MGKILNQVRERRDQRNREAQSEYDSAAEEMIAIAARDAAGQQKPDDADRLDAALTHTMSTERDYQLTLNAIRDFVDRAATAAHYATHDATRPEAYRAALVDMHLAQAALNKCQQRANRLKREKITANEAAAAWSRACKEHPELVPGGEILDVLRPLVASKKNDLAKSEADTIASGDAMADRHADERIRKQGLA